jgi:glutamine synthetase
MTTAKDILKQIKDNDVKFVDLRFTDPKGKLQHVTMDVVEGRRGHVRRRRHVRRLLDRRLEGHQRVRHGADARPETSSTWTRSSPSRPWSSICDILEPVSGEAYNRDPRGTAKKAEAYMKSEGIGDTVYVGPEAEFFVFDDVKYKADPYNTGFKLDSTELPSNDDTDYETGNLGHRPRVKGGYFPVPPIDSCRTCAPRC